MSDHSTLYATAAKLLTKGKGILAADQSSGTMDKLLVGIGLTPDAELRRQYRELLFTTPGIEQYTSGVILYDSSIRNQTSEQVRFVDVLTAKGIVPIIKVDASTVPHTGFPGEVVTQGLDNLEERLFEYYELGARAAKWRAVFKISSTTPTEQNILYDCIQLARYAALCHQAGLVPLVEPEVLYEGEHTLERAEEVTTAVLAKLFDILTWYQVDLRAVILKSSMVLAGSAQAFPSDPKAVAAATVRTFTKTVPPAVPGIVFLSGGQTPEQATANLDALGELESAAGGLPWELAFSFSRALEDPVRAAWQGEAANIAAAQAILLERLRLNSLADSGAYETGMEGA